MNELSLMSVGTSGPRGNGMKLWRLAGHRLRSRSHEAKDRFWWPGGSIIVNPSGLVGFWFLQIKFLFVTQLRVFVVSVSNE